MSTMPLFQQEQPFSNRNFPKPETISTHHNPPQELSFKNISPLAIAALAITAIALSIFTHPLVGIAFVFFESAALYTNSKAITCCVITTLTLLITTLSLSVLFPPATVITAPLTLLASIFTVIYTSTLLVIKFRDQAR